METTHEIKKKRKRPQGKILFKDARPDLWKLVDRELTKSKQELTDKQIDSISHCSAKLLCFRCATHTTCNDHVWITSPSNFTGSGCPYCNNSGTNKACLCDPNLLSVKRPDVFKRIDRELTKKHENLTDYEIDRLFNKSTQFVHFKCQDHKTCDLHFWRASVCGARGCPYCCNHGKWSKICPCLSLQAKHPKVSEYWSKENKAPGPEAVHPQSNKVVKWHCKKCNYKWEATIYKFIQLVRGCPNCTKLAEESVGAEACRETLINMKEPFDDRKTTMPGLIYKSHLRFDFICPARTTPARLKICLEYDGSQHFTFSSRFHRTIDDFKQGHMRDLIKNRFCGENKIHLLRISFSIPVEKVPNAIRRFFARLETAEPGQSIVQYVGKEYDSHYFTEW